MGDGRRRHGVNIGALADPAEVYVSTTVTELVVGSGLTSRSAASTR